MCVCGWVCPRPRARTLPRHHLPAAVYWDLVGLARPRVHARTSPHDPETLSGPTLAGQCYVGQSTGGPNDVRLQQRLGDPPLSPGCVWVSRQMGVVGQSTGWATDDVCRFLRLGHILAAHARRPPGEHVAMRRQLPLGRALFAAVDAAASQVAQPAACSTVSAAAQASRAQIAGLSSQVTPAGSRAGAGPWPWALAALPVGLACAGGAVALADASSSDASSKPAETHLLSLETRQRIFFTYEKRIRWGVVHSRMEPVPGPMQPHAGHVRCKPACLSLGWAGLVGGVLTLRAPAGR